MLTTLFYTGTVTSLPKSSPDQHRSCQGRFLNHHEVTGIGNGVTQFFDAASQPFESFACGKEEAVSSRNNGLYTTNCRE